MAKSAVILNKKIHIFFNNYANYRKELKMRVYKLKKQNKKGRKIEKIE